MQTTAAANSGDSTTIKNKKSLSDYLNELNTTTKGLTDEEAKNRLSQYGYNELVEKETNPVLKHSM